MPRIYALLLSGLALASILLAASCYQSTGIYNQPPPAPNEVNVYDDSFDPDTLAVSAGTRVTWNNRGYNGHSATSDQGVFDSGALDPGKSFSFTFQDTGSFAYHCNFHPKMMAVIIVR